LGLAAIVVLAWSVSFAPLLAAKPTKVAKPPVVRKGASAAATERNALASADPEGAPVISAAGSDSARHPVEPLQAATRVDEIITAELKKTSFDVAPRCSDEDFLRRVSFDLAGVSPSPEDVALFGLDPDAQKRAHAIDRLLASADYAENWGRYWRDVVFSRATDVRAQFARKSFESWMTLQFAAKKPWSEIATAMLTATGDVYEDGATAFIFAQQADPKEVASETARVFLGIQLQCANCHDHPTDSWKRDQFHSLAAFFPRMRLQPKRESMGRSFELVSFNGGGLIRRFDTNRDGKISREEAKQGANQGQFVLRLFDQGDSNKDGFLTADEIKKLPPPLVRTGVGSPEYHMPDLQHPQSEGKKLDPVFFLGNHKPGAGLSDLDRRKSLARYITAPDNPWFARAFVNRMWGQLVGEGFYMPIDDIGPERTANYPAALEALSSGFTASGYDVAWLFRAIANTETYQRQIRPRDPKAPAPAFASASPVRLRADHLFDALIRVLGLKEEDLQRQQPDVMGMARRFDNTQRGRFHQKFSFDPSTAPDELTGTIPQALYMMNSGLVNNLIRAGGQTRLHQILDKYKSDDDALSELYLVVHAREPSAKEAQVCRDYLKQVNNRQEAFEDILWSLINSTEFQTKR